MGRYDQYSDEELIVRLREGETEISDYLMEKYKEFVRKKARAMFLIGGETDDLIQEGMIGLFKAIQNYQPDREASFQTFAGLCIDRQLYSAVQNSNSHDVCQAVFASVYFHMFILFRNRQGSSESMSHWHAAFSRDPSYLHELIVW